MAAAIGHNSRVFRSKQNTSKKRAARCFCIVTTKNKRKHFTESKYNIIYIIIISSTYLLYCAHLYDELPTLFVTVAAIIVL